MFDLTNPIYTDKDKAREHLEAMIWPDGVYCKHCGSFDKITKLQGKSTRPGVFKCNSCRKPFTVTVGTIFEDSKIALNKWLLGFRLMAGSKKGISAHQLHRSLGITYKSAWFMAHRIREAMRSDDNTPFGSDGGMVEVDETFIGRDRSKPQNVAGYQHKMKVLALVDRNSGRSRSFVIDTVTVQEIDPILSENIANEAHLMTDEHRVYHSVGRYYAEHSKVSHSAGEYVSQKRPELHTNTIEGFFSIFKRGMKGIYQHCGKQHLHRYLAEFDFRYSNRIANGVDDTERTNIALRGTVGRRLVYRIPSIAA